MKRIGGKSITDNIAMKILGFAQDAQNKKTMDSRVVAKHTNAKNNNHPLSKSMFQSSVPYCQWLDSDLVRSL